MDKHDAAGKLKAFKSRENDKVKSYLKDAGAKSAIPKYAEGGRVKPNTTVNIVINKDKPDNGLNDAAAMAAMAPKPPAPPPPPPPSPPQGGPPGGAPAIPGLPNIPGMAKGGRTGSYPLDSGSMSGPGRLEKAISEAKKEGKKPGFKKTNA